MHICVEAYHGGFTLEGNECHKVLKNAEKLLEILPEDLHCFVRLLVSFREVVHACFTAKKLLPDYRAKIAQYCDAVLEVHSKHGFSITPKIHIIMDHLIEWLDVFGVPLGKFSEHELEATHYEFNKLWTKRFQVKEISSPDYTARLLKACLTFNERNLSYT